jgi:hypothetical protein
MAHRDPAPAATRSQPSFAGWARPQTTSSAVLALQRAAGNRATGGVLRSKAVMRPERRVLAQCEGACTCGGRCGAGPTGDEWRDLTPGVEVDEAAARAIVDEAIATLGPLGATTVPMPSDALASNRLARAPERSGQRMLTRAAALSWGKLEVGVIGAIQGTYDPCSGFAGGVGWVWVGAGVRVNRGPFGGTQWYGAYVYFEGEFPEKQVTDPLVACGTCAPRCNSSKEGHFDWGAGIAGFPVVLEPRKWKNLELPGIELGALLTPKSRCDGYVELIGLFDLRRIFGGPIGNGVAATEKLINKLGKKYGIHAHCGLGVNLSGTLHVCRGPDGSWTSDSAKIGLGGHFSCDIGLSRDRKDLPGAGSAPQQPAVIPPLPAPLPPRRPPPPPPRRQRRRPPPPSVRPPAPQARP